MSGHALLSPSSSSRWINCPPSAKLNADDDTGSSYAQQGTDAHSLCEYKVLKALGKDVKDPTEDLDYFDEFVQNWLAAGGQETLDWLDAKYPAE